MKWEDISFDIKGGERCHSIMITHSVTDGFRDSVIRSMNEINSFLRTAKTFRAWIEMPYQCGDEGSPAFGVVLRERVSAVVKMSVRANGVFDGRIDTRSLRRATRPRCTLNGIPLRIQRRGRRMSLTLRHYLWNGATFLNKLSQVFVKSHGLIECLRLVKENSKIASFRETHPITVGQNHEQNAI